MCSPTWLADGVQSTFACPAEAATATRAGNRRLRITDPGAAAS